ncbi:putative cuticle protein [Operophtera brumata]|uniref:Putative cuticle protein n=1 Tax=Operophtera brumata TaxID=104452 RepID=A0A0L7LGP4_OPEBR|nr:putative cuticle protein [Operophtera brumata]
MMKLVVLSCVLAAASASGLLAPFAPLIYSAPLGLTPYNYRGPFSLAPGQPANILGSDGRPLDTLDVNLDRSAHFTAKALDNVGLHVLKKRSAALIAPFNPIVYSAPLLQPYNYRGPLSLAPSQPANILGSDGRPLDTLEVNLDRSAHLTAKVLDNGGFHILKKRSVPVIAPVFGSRIALTHTPLITPAVPITRITPIGTPVFTQSRLCCNLPCGRPQSVAIRPIGQMRDNGEIGVIPMGEMGVMGTAGVMNGL